jgi:hypothetical protein
MKLMVSSYHNTNTVWNAEVEETQLRSYEIEHAFNAPAKCIITLNDPDGSLMQKYNADADDVYLGVGKITLEDPTGTDIFYGRIRRAVGDSEARTVTLECYDWLDQLNDELITYDMREKLNGNVRQSTICSDWDDTDGHGIAPANSPISFYVYDAKIGLTANAHNTQYLIFTTGMAGSNTWGMGPYTHTTTAAVGIDTDSFDGVFGDLWNDDVLGHLIADNDEDYTVDYEFNVYLGHNTPSDFYVHDSVTGARLILTHFLTITGVEGAVYVRNAANTAWYDIGNLEPTDDAVYRKVTFEIPEAYAQDMVDANGMTKIRFDIDHNGVAADLSIRYLRLEIDCETTGKNTSTLINDTETYRLTVTTDFTAAANQIWDEVPYCIVKPIYLHLESATGPILGGDSIVTLTAGAANIENTTGLSTTQFKDKPRLKILQALAEQDASVFWITLGGTTVTYKKTFGADTIQLTDGKVLSWQSLYDYRDMFNSYKVYGARLGDYEIYQLSENAASKTKYLSTKSKVLRRAGLVSDYGASALGTTLAAKTNEVEQMVGCTIYGNTATAAHATTIKLGEIVEITSSYLWPTAAKDYIVSRFAYDSVQNKTHLTLYPKASTGYRLIELSNPVIEAIHTSTESEKYVPDPVTHEVV